MGLLTTGGVMAMAHVVGIVAMRPQPPNLVRLTNREPRRGVLWEPQ